MFGKKMDGLLLLGLGLYCLFLVKAIADVGASTLFIPPLILASLVAFVFGVDALTGLRLMRYLASLKRG